MDIRYLQGYKFVLQDKHFAKEACDVRTEYITLFPLSSTKLEKNHLFKLVRWPVSCCCFEKFQQQHGLRDVHKILNNSIDILVSYFFMDAFTVP